VGNAPRRNRIKRRLREVFRLNLPQLPGGVDLLVTARDPLAATCSFTLLQEDFLATLHRALRRSPPPPPAAREQDRD
jgi:ribonuclease P protein component